MGSGSEVGLVVEYSSGLVLDASMKASMRRSRYKCAGSMVKVKVGDWPTRVSIVD